MAARWTPRVTWAANAPGQRSAASHLAAGSPAKSQCPKAPASSHAGPAARTHANRLRSAGLPRADARAAREAVLLTTTRPRQAERPPAAGNPPPFPDLRAPPGSTGRLLQLAEPPHPRRVTPRGGKQQRIRDDLAVHSPDSSREIVRATGVDQHLRTSAPCRTARLPRHVPDLPTGELPLKLAPALTVPHGLSPPSTLSNTRSPGHEYPPPNALR
jgi:hypothetical protein